MHLKIELRDPLLEPLLHISHSFVVDSETNLFEQESKQPTGGNVAYWFLHIFLEISLNGGDRICSSFFSQFN
jgi:hypothetical protein